MKFRAARPWYLFVIGLTLLGGIIYYMWANAGELVEYLHLSTAGIVALLLLSLASPLINGLTNALLFERLGARVSYYEGILLAASTSLANQLPIPGGILAKGMYLKRRHDLSYLVYFSAMLALFFCSVTVNGMIGAGVLVYWLLVRRIEVPVVLMAGFAAMTALALVFIIPWSRLRLPLRVQGWVDQTLEGWKLISSDPCLLAKLLGLQTGLMLILALRYWLAFHMLSQEMTAGQVLLMSSASILTQLASFAPGGLGVQEAIVGAIASTLGFDLSISVAAVEVDRVPSTLVILLLGWIGTVLLGRYFVQQEKGSAETAQKPFAGPQ